MNQYLPQGQTIGLPFRFTSAEREKGRPLASPAKHKTVSSIINC